MLSLHHVLDLWTSADISRALREDFEDYIAHNVMDNDCQDFDCIRYFVARHNHG